MIIICTNGDSRDVLSLEICLEGIERYCNHEEVLIFTNCKQFFHPKYKVILTDTVHCNCEGNLLYGSDQASGMLIRLAAFDWCIKNNKTNVLYLDTDAIIVGDISELLEMRSYALSNTFNKVKYFNSGVLKLDLSLYKFSFVELYKQTESKTWKYPDQDFLNVVLNVDITNNKKYNWTSVDIGKDQHPSIIHFVGGKPWVTTKSHSSIEKTKRILHLVKNPVSISNIEKFFYCERVGK